MQTTTSPDMPLEASWWSKYYAARLVMRSFLAGHRWRSSPCERIFMARGSFGYVASCMPQGVQSVVLSILQALTDRVFEAWYRSDAAWDEITQVTIKERESHYVHGVACALSIYADLVLEQNVKTEPELLTILANLSRDLAANEAGILEVVTSKATAYFPLQ